jgi:hypothetical protein
MGEVTSELERIIGLSHKSQIFNKTVIYIYIYINVMNDGSNEWDAVSTSITGDFDSGRTPSSHGDLR